MPKEDWVKNPVHQILEKNNLWLESVVETALDVACGLSLKSQYLKPSYIVGVDIHEPYLKAIDYSGPYTAIKYDVRNVGELFLDNSFDVVYALDIIEHLEKDESLHLIKECKRIAKQAVVIETPKGFVPQNIDIQGFDADHWQTHRCGWEVDELEELGFKCVTRPYKMVDVKRHTEIDVSCDIELINGIYIKGDK